MVAAPSPTVHPAVQLRRRRPSSGRGDGGGALPYAPSGRPAAAAAPSPLLDLAGKGGSGALPYAPSASNCCGGGPAAGREMVAASSPMLHQAVQQLRQHPHIRQIWREGRRWGPPLR